MSWDHMHASQNTDWFAGLVETGKIRTKDGVKKAREPEGISELAFVAVMNQLANYVNDGKEDPDLKDWAWPPRKKLAKRAKVGVSTVNKAKRWATHLGFFLEVQQVKGDDKELRPTRYRFRELKHYHGIETTDKDGKKIIVGGKLQFKADDESAEDGWAPDESLRGTVAMIDRTAERVYHGPTFKAAKTKGAKTKPDKPVNPPPPVATNLPGGSVVTTQGSVGDHTGVGWSPTESSVVTTGELCGGQLRSVGDHTEKLISKSITPKPQGEGHNQQQQQQQPEPQAAVAAVVVASSSPLSFSCTVEDIDVKEPKLLSNGVPARDGVWGEVWANEVMYTLGMTAYPTDWVRIFDKLTWEDWLEFRHWIENPKNLDYFKTGVKRPAEFLAKALPGYIKADHQAEHVALPSFDAAVQFLLDHPGFTRNGKEFKFINSEKHGPVWAQMSEDDLCYHLAENAPYDHDLPLPEDLCVEGYSLDSYEKEQWYDCPRFEVLPIPPGPVGPPDSEEWKGITIDMLAYIKANPIQEPKVSPSKSVANPRQMPNTSTTGAGQVPEGKPKVKAMAASLPVDPRVVIVDDDWRI